MRRSLALSLLMTVSGGCARETAVTWKALETPVFAANFPCIPSELSGAPAPMSTVGPRPEEETRWSCQISAARATRFRFAAAPVGSGGADTAYRGLVTAALGRRLGEAPGTLGPALKMHVVGDADFPRLAFGRRYGFVLDEPMGDWPAGTRGEALVGATSHSVVILSALRSSDEDDRVRRFLESLVLFPDEGAEPE